MTPTIPLSPEPNEAAAEGARAWGCTWEIGEFLRLR